jgi:4-hydroxythreonine-4-phosphate dehydrogenase
VAYKAVKLLKAEADFTLIGSTPVLRKISGVRLIDLANIKCGLFSPGKIKAEYGRASIGYLDKAMELIRDNQIDCLVTAPISKEAVAKAGLRYTGHTEYFVKKTKAKHAVMMLLNNKLRFSLLTRHIPLQSVSRSLNREGLLSNILVTHRALRNLFGLRNPRIAVCGMNPHASDNGLIGKEERSIMLPAINRVNKILGKSSVTLLPSDIAVLKAMQKEFDSLVAIYHDQALIPLKLSDCSTGVNITLGLPFIRTSPLHGTAFDIASNPKSINPDSMIAAIRLAIKCAYTQKRA